MTEQLLARWTPTDTSNLTLFTATVKTIIKSIRVCNYTNTDCTFRILAWWTGLENAVYYDMNLPANQSIWDDWFLVLEVWDTLTVQSGTANSLTFTLSWATL